MHTPDVKQHLQVFMSVEIHKAQDSTEGTSAEQEEK